MAYKPSLDDLPSGGYMPSLDDLPPPPMQKPTVASQGQFPMSPGGRRLQPQEEFSNPTQWPGFDKLPRDEQLRRIAFSATDPANMTATGGFVPGGTFEGAPSTYEGILQSIANYPIKIANLFKKNPISEFDFAPKNTEAKAGGAVGDVMSFFMPGKAAELGLQGLEKAPYIGQGVNALTKAITSSPFLRGATNVARTGSEAALFNAAHNPDDAGMSALEGLGIGGGTQLAANFLTNQNPLVKLLARMGVGAGLGYPLGHPYYGALAGAGAPEAAKLVGIGGKNAIVRDLTEGLTQRDFARAKAANDRLGTVVTPAQASGNYVTAGYEGALKKSPQGAQYAYRQEQAQNRQQRNAINEMLDSIYKPTPQSEANINSLYEQAHGVNLDNNALRQIKSNPLWSSALSQARQDPSLIAKLQREGIAFKPAYNDVDHAKAVLDKRINKAYDAGDTEKAEKMLDNYDATIQKMMKQKTLNENNYQFLDEAKTKLDDMYQSAINRGDLRQARRINDERQSYLAKLDELNPTYKEARAAAQPKMVRENIENKFNKNEEDFTGKNFYNKFLNTRKSYQDLLRDTKNFPEAQEAIKDMRQGWKHLSNIKSVSQGEAQGKTGLDQARDIWKATVGAIKRYAGAKGDVQALKIAYSPDWDKEFDRIMQLRDTTQRRRELATLISKVGIAYGLNPNEEE